MSDELETWENLSDARFFVKKYTSKGDLADEMIGSKRRFHLTTNERHINQEIAATSEQDPFANGSFSPVRLLDGTEDADEIASNPNLMGESEMATIVKGNLNGLKKRLTDVKNTIVLERMLQVAVEADSAMSKIQAIRDRIEELTPEAAFTRPEDAPINQGTRIV